MCVCVKEERSESKVTFEFNWRRLRTFESNFITAHQNPSCLSGSSAAGQAEGRRVARTFPGGCWVKREQEGEEGHQTPADGETGHSTLTFTGCRCLHRLQILVLLVEHPQVLRAAGLKNMSPDVGQHVQERVRRQCDSLSCVMLTWKGGLPTRHW